MTTYVDDPIARKCNEINDIVALPFYKDVIDTLIKRILSDKCSLTIDESSIIDFSTGKKPKTRYVSKTIYLRKEIDKRLPAKFHNDGRAWIYVLLHEFGHHLDPDTRRYNCLQRFSRERRAWCYARREFNQLKIAYPFLASDYLDFLEYWSFCIGEYEKEYKSVRKRKTDDFLGRTSN